MKDKKIITKKLKGIVVSDKMQKTRVVAVESFKKHSLYKKYYKVTNRFKVHDEKNEYKTGDKVIIKQTRPLSKEKNWIILEKIK